MRILRKVTQVIKYENGEIGSLNNHIGIMEKKIGNILQTERGLFKIKDKMLDEVKGNGFSLVYVVEKFN
jgi:hypothetical protein